MSKLSLLWLCQMAPISGYPLAKSRLEPDFDLFMDQHINIEVILHYHTISCDDQITGRTEFGFAAKFIVNHTLNLLMLTGYYFIYEGVVHYTFASETKFGYLWLYGNCGGDYYNSSGVIDYPWYGGNYTNDACCIWNITASAPINITFIRFDLEWTFDYLFVYGRNSSNSAWTWIDTLNGKRLPSPIQTNSNTVMLQFVSDFSVAFSGFELDW
ncbi:unnamed protein product, partial [Meganyctiphanes norvegica]